MRTILSINQQWLYKPEFCEEKDLKQMEDNGCYEPVCLPHTNLELPYNYFDEEACCFVSCYKRKLALEPQWKGKRLFLDFEGVMSDARVYVNGIFAGEHKGGYTAFDIEITDLVDFAVENEVTVVVDSTERPDIPPFGGQIDYLTYGGIYREVQLRVVSPVYLEDVFITTPGLLTGNRKLSADILLNGLEKEQSDLTVQITLLDGTKEISSLERAVSYDSLVHLELEPLDGIVLWSLNHPKLYKVKCVLFQGKCEIDCYEVRIGFREVQFMPEGFYLNGEKIKLNGLNRHQSYPYTGYAMPARVQRKDADILKYELGLNTVRTSHYPQSRHFLDRCDEIGLLVFEETPGWQHIGDEEWQLQVLQDIKEMIIHDRNHPSIFLWGVRINESQDHHSLYTRTNQLAKELDPTRPTGGVRYLCNSEFLEDVYTMNDFIHDNGYGKYLSSVIRNYKTYDHLQGKDGACIALREPKDVTGLAYDVPYLVCEYNGHMYPTKRFDQEERAAEHALRHSRVLNASWGNDAIAGAIGWCAFDYNTHADFGSGDKICYHGVMDMFRIPKFAAYAYSSQKSPDEEVILEPATYWARGERSIGGVIPLVIFTNCDEVRFYYGDELKGTFQPDWQHYPALSHPPVVIDEMAGEWGMRWEDGVFAGYVHGKEVIRNMYSRNSVPTHLTLTPDDFSLKAGDWDATRIVVKVSDQLHNTLPFLQEPVSIKVGGTGVLIGPSELSLIGGQTAFWVRTTGETGTIHISVTCPVLKKCADAVIAVDV
ncbi:glycoside hydrolase family 2 TIM barrel-domain containing protein [Lacrimispora sp.]|uniref:glycoside hydrolase family 2 protein n=1 Tax=Lacrimispora sp. TaxID=2719234 RepID=UPI003993D097